MVVKKGIFRVLAGLVLIVLQVLAVVGASLSPHTNSGIHNLGYYVGFYSPAIVGITLLISGIRAYLSGSQFELILHIGSKKAHIVMKWVSFAVSTLLFVYELIFCIRFFSIDVISSILCMFSALAFSVYALFYMYKKPTCLFSISLFLRGATYIYSVIDILPKYFYHYSRYFFVIDPADFVFDIFTNILPLFLAGIVYIVVAIILYKEVFSVKVVKILGWILLALEFPRMVIFDVLNYGIGYLASFWGIMNALFVAILILCICILKIDTIRRCPAPFAFEKQIPQQDYMAVPVPSSGWRCSCGRPHPRYETSCICGKSKFENMKPKNADEMALETQVTRQKTQFCHSCGEKLIDNSLFCHICSTKAERE